MNGRAKVFGFKLAACCMYVSNRIRKFHYLRLAMVAAVLQAAFVARAQELEPRAYSISPQGTNFLILGFTRFTGDVSFDPTLPVEEATSTLHTTALGYVRATDVAGRSASVGLVVPYVWGSVQGLVYGSFQQALRSGLADPAFRFAINLHGAPAMNAAEFKDYKQKTNVGASVVVIAPLGQYDPARLLNIGTNRWAVKPEIGISQRFGRWYLDLYAGTWIFTANHSFPLGVRRQDPIGIAQSSLTCVITPRVWASFNANLYTGGRTSVAGVDRADYLHNSRMGGTLAIRVTRHQSIKFNGSNGVVTNIGAAFVSIGVAYQYMWGGGM
jgi:Putative MetA-pathway of phenol degradation